jgi:acetyl-CoA carboxylase carboxyl transferase subunit alpha
MDSTSFDFEKPIADLIEQREKVKQVAEKSKVDVSATLKEINHKIEKTRKEIFIEMIN